MRTTTAGELAVLANQSRRYTARVKIANGSGTLIDRTSMFNAAKITHDIDQPVSGATVSFIRSQGSTQSLAPLRTDSTLNRLDDGVTYAPALDLNRRITIEVATTAIGAPVLNADYKMLFDGTTDSVNSEKNPVVLECRDKGAPLVDRWIEAEAFYSTTPVGTAIQTVMQQIIDDVFGAGVHVLYVPVSPAFNIVKYRQQRMSVMDALQDLVQLIGWDVRYKWDDGTSAFRLTLSEPPRTKTVPDYTFGPNAYIDIGQLGIELTNIRNVIEIKFRDSNDNGNDATVTVSDAPSITKYGRRYFYMQENSATSPIDTAAEATTMITAALADLKDPKAEQGKNAPLFWPADISDLYRYSPNGVHYNTSQDWAVVEFDHEIAADHFRTNFKVRGGPAGQYNTWLGRGGTMGGGGANSAFPPVPRIRPLNTEADETEWDLEFSATHGSGGGGTNLTWEIFSKSATGVESSIGSGNESAFPHTEVIARDPRLDKVIRFWVQDAATGMEVEVYYTVPSAKPSIESGTGKLLGGQLVALSVATAAYANNSVTKAKTEARFRASTGRTATQSIPNITPTDLAFTTDFFDVGGITTASGIEIPTGGDTGTWFFSAQVSFGTNATGYRSVAISKNGVVVANTIVVPVTGQPTITNVIHMESSLTVGDDFTVTVAQNSGGALVVDFTFTAFSAIHLW